MLSDRCKTSHHTQHRSALVGNACRDSRTVHAEDPRHILSAVDNVTVWIALGGPEDPTKFRDVPASRLEIIFEGDKPVLDKTFEKKVRTAELLIGHVTTQRAKAYGFDYDHWLKTTEEAIKVDYPKLAELGRKIALRLERGSKVHITSQGGTDVRF